MPILDLRQFLQDQQDAAALSMQTGLPYDESLQRINEARAEERKRQASPLAALEDLPPLHKLAEELGQVSRKDMPQMRAAEAVDNEEIPTGKEESGDPADFKSVQKHVNRTKVDALAKNWETIRKKPILVSKDDWILDGHHRAEAARKLGRKVRYVRVDLPGEKALALLRKHEG